MSAHYSNKSVDLSVGLEGACPYHSFFGVGSGWIQALKTKLIEGKLLWEKEKERIEKR